MKYFFCILSISILSHLPAQDYSIDDLTEFIMTENPGLQRARYQYGAAARDRAPIYNYRNIGLSYSGNLGTEIASDPRDPANFTNNLELTLPIIDQIRLKGSLQFATEIGAENGEGRTVSGGSLGLDIDPFVTNTQRTSSEHALLNAQNALSALEVSVYFTGRNTILHYLSSRENSGLSEEKFAIEQQNYENSRESYSLALMSYDDLRRASNDLNDARRELTTARLAFIDARQSLLALLGPNWVEGSIAPYPLEDLVAETELLQQRIDSADPSTLRSSSLEELGLQLVLEDERLRKTLVFDPGLSVSLSIGSDDFTSPARFTAGLSLNLSPANINSAMREDIEQRIREIQVDIARERQTLSNTMSSTLERLTEAQFSHSLTEEAYENARIVFEETKVLAEYGDRTPVELRRSEWDMKKAALTLYQAAMTLLRYQGDYLKMIY